MNLQITPLAFLCLCATAILRAERADVLRAGAKANGKALNTKLINSTTDRLDRGGGGALFFPAGTYLAGSIHLKGNITLELETGATLLFSDDSGDYLPFIEVRHERVVMKSFQSLIYAVDTENITIKGEGTLNGQDKKWQMKFFRVVINLKDNGMRGIDKYQPMWDAQNDTTAIYAETNKDYVDTLQRRFFRPPFIQPVRYEKAKIEGVKVVSSPFWTINPELYDSVTIKRITINDVPSLNADGINPEFCRNVHINDCHISIGGDCIAIESGRDAQARRLGIPRKNITITNCTMLPGHGGIVIDNEMSGSMRKITISNYVFDGTGRGIRIKLTRGEGGVVEDIRVSNIVMNSIKQEAAASNPKHSQMPAKVKSERTPIFRNVHISNMTATDVKTSIKMVELKETPIFDIILRGIHIQGARQKCIFEDCKRITMDNIVINGEEIRLK